MEDVSRIDETGKTRMSLLQERSVTFFLVLCDATTMVASSPLPMVLLVWVLLSLFWLLLSAVAVCHVSLSLPFLLVQYWSYRVVAVTVIFDVAVAIAVAGWLIFLTFTIFSYLVGHIYPLAWKL